MNQQKIAGPVVLALVLALGIATFWGMMGSWIVGIVDQEYRSEGPRYNVVVCGDGTPVLHKQGTMDYFSLEGEPIERFASLRGARLWHGRNSGSFGRPEWSRRVCEFRVNTGGTVKPGQTAIWHFVHDGLEQGSGYFVGYELLGNRRIGYLGTRGFSDEKPSRDARFAMGLREYTFRLSIMSQILKMDEFGQTVVTVLLLRSPNGVFEVDLEQRAVREVFRDRTVLAIDQLTWGTPARSVPRRKAEQGIAVRTPNGIVVISSEGEEDVVATYAVPESIQSGSPDTFYMLPNGQGLVVDRRDDRATGLASATLSWIDADGNILDQKDVSLGKTGQEMSVGSGSLVFSSIMPMPAVTVPLIVSIGTMTEHRLHSDLSLMQSLMSTLRQSWPPLLGLLILAAILSWATVRRQRKYALPWTRTWAAFVFLFGIPGYLAYLCHRKWPVREECMECHESAPQDREACAFCDAPLPVPEPKGIEIFA